MILQTPITIAKPTENATTILRTKASILPALILAALSAITKRAGSATVVPKPIINANRMIHPVEPLCAKSLARPSPTGKIPTSRPRRKTARPTPTIARPIVVLNQFSGTV